MQQSLDFLRTAVEKIDKARLAYTKSRMDEVAKKQLYDNKEVESLKLRRECKSETEFNNVKRAFVLSEKQDYENAQDQVREVIKKFDMLRELIQLHKFLVNQEDEQIKLQKYEA